LEVSADQVGNAVDARSSDIGNEGGRRAARELDEARCHLIGIDRLEREAGRHRDDGRAGQLFEHPEDEVVKLRRPNRRRRKSGPGNDLFRLPLHGEVAKHHPVDPSCNRHALGANDRDVDEVWSVPTPGGGDEVFCRDVIALVAPRTVHDRIDAINGSVDPGTEEEVASHETNIGCRVVGSTSEDANVMSGSTEPAHDVTAERARAAG
jgi:hypothetical protein